MVSIKSMKLYSRFAALKLCIATLFELLSSKVQICSALEKSFVIMDQTNAYIVTARNSTKVFDYKHNMTENIHFLYAKPYEKSLVAVYGHCANTFVGYIHVTNLFNGTVIGSIPLATIGGNTGVCGVAPGSVENTFYVTMIDGRITFYNKENNSLTQISHSTMTCRFNPVLDHKEGFLYFLEGKCNPTKSSQLIILDIANNITKIVTLSDQVKKMEIDFTTNETFAISDLNKLMIGKIDTKTLTLADVRNVKMKVKDITLTPTELYFIMDDGSFMKVKRSGDDAPEKVFKSITFNNPAVIAYVHYDAASGDKGFSSSMSPKLHLAFYFVIILVNLELWNL